MLSEMRKLGQQHMLLANDIKTLLGRLEDIINDRMERTASWSNKQQIWRTD